MSIKLNHIGLVVRDIQKSAEILRTLGLKERTQPEPDPIQKVTACFITAGADQAIHIELLEPTDESSPITNFLSKRGEGLHHLCFEVDDIDLATDELKQKGFQVVSPPVECIGYDRSFRSQCTVNTKIAFLMLPNKLLIELLQKGV